VVSGSALEAGGTPGLAVVLGVLAVAAVVAARKFRS
jgi:hypothetical protein